MSESGTNATIVAAIIGVIGSITVALISNWDKFFPKQAVTPPAPTITGDTGTSHGATTTGKIEVTTIPPAIAPARIDIGGTWYNPAAPANGSFIVQQNNDFQFKGWGMLPQGIAYESKGSGEIIAQTVTYNYIAQYQNGWASQGNCSGTVSANGSQLTATCTDNLLGTFVSSGIKQ